MTSTQVPSFVETMSPEDKLITQRAGICSREGLVSLPLAAQGSAERPGLQLVPWEVFTRDGNRKGNPPPKDVES